MGYFYVDDSVHDEAGFIIGACVYSKDDLTRDIADILSKSNFDPQIFEFKSSINYKKNPEMAAVREELRRLFNDNCKFGLVIIPRSERINLGIECINGITQFIKHNSLPVPIELYFDQGLFETRKKAEQSAKNSDIQSCNFHFEQDSIVAKGLQLADMVAHTAGIILKDQMGLVVKLVKAGVDSGYDPNTDIELGSEMRASFRYSIFREKSKRIIDDPIADSTFNVEQFGLYISHTCDASLSQYAKDAFAEVYLGCVH